MSTGIPLINPYVRALKEYVRNAMPERYTDSIDDTLERIAHNIATQKDMTAIVTLMAELYSSGYRKALNSAQEALDAKGIKIRVIDPEKKVLTMDHR